MITRQITRENLKNGVLVRHFKGGIYRIIGVAKLTETPEELVIYSPHNDSALLYARPIDMFLSKVDKNKYPYIRQKYRFEIITNQNKEVVHEITEQDL